MYISFVRHMHKSCFFVFYDSPDWNRVHVCISISLNCSANSSITRSSDIAREKDACERQVPHAYMSAKILSDCMPWDLKLDCRMVRRINTRSITVATFKATQYYVEHMTNKFRLCTYSKNIASGKGPLAATLWGPPQTEFAMCSSWYDSN